MVRFPVARFLSIATAVGMLLASAGRADAGGGLLVTPVVIDQPVKKSGETLPPIKVVNDGTEELDVVINFNSLGHDRTGTPTSPPESYKFNAAKMLSAKPDKFKLAPGKSMDVVVKVNVPGGRTGGAYSTMYILGKPKQKANESITSYIQVGVIIELALPGTPKNRVSPGKVYALQDKPGTPVTLFAGATNLGDTHVKVGGTLVVSNEKGAEVTRLTLEPANVLPTFTRDIKVTWKAPPSLPAGKYKLAATLNGPGLGNETAYGTMQVIKAGELARATGFINNFKTPPVVQKKPIKLEATVTNNGNSPYAPVGKVTFTDAKGNEIVAAMLRAQGPLKPGSRGAISGALPAGLSTGKYNAKLELMNDSDFVLANNTQTLQVIEKDVVTKGEISKMIGPSEKEPFVTVEFKNTGNTAVDVEGVINVVDSGGNTVEMVPLEKKAVAVGANVSYKRGLPAGIASGTYDLRAVLTYGGAAPADKAVKHFAK